MFGLSGAGFIGLKLAGIEARHQYEKTKDRKHVLFFPLPLLSIYFVVPSLMFHLCSHLFLLCFILHVLASYNKIRHDKNIFKFNWLRGFSS